MNAMRSDDSILIAGHRGLVGSALARRLRSDGYGNLLTPGSEELDLRDQSATEAYMDSHRPDLVFLCAAKVGGILANDRFAAEFIRDNLAIQTNLIHAAWLSGTRKFLFLGSSCIYPKLAEQPIRESSLLTGPLEPSNQWYAIAKIAGIRMCQAYRKQYGFEAICAMPTNLYGPGDNFHPEYSHVVPGLIRRFHEAVESGADSVIIWGTGTPRRELMHSDDAASALVHLMRTYSSDEIVNVGSGQETSIKELAGLIASVVGFRGEIIMDPSRPDGTPRKRLDTSVLESQGWRPGIDLETGIKQTYAWFLENVAPLAAGQRA